MNKSVEVRRSLKQIVLDEAILVMPKLTKDQINVLTLIFSAVYYNHHGILNLPSLVNYLNNKLLYFYTQKKNSYSFFTHLQYTGCCTLLSEGSTYKPFEQILKNRFKALFIKGFSDDAFKTEFGEETAKLRPLLIKCIQNPILFQFSPINDDVFKSVNDHFFKLESDNLNLAQIEQAMSFQNKFIMIDQEINDFLSSKNSLMNNFLKDWKEKDFKNIRPTSVGFAIAVLNYNRITGESVPIEAYI